jgi:hypothetical protein
MEAVLERTESCVVIIWVWGEEELFSYWPDCQIVSLPPPHPLKWQYVSRVFRVDFPEKQQIMFLAWIAFVILLPASAKLIGVILISR